MDKSATSVNFISKNTGQALILWNINEYDGEWRTTDDQWVDALSAANKPYTIVNSSSVPTDLGAYSLIIDLRGHSYNQLDVSGYEAYLKTSGHVLYMIASDAPGTYNSN